MNSEWLSRGTLLPPPVVCGSQGRWANKIRCSLVFSGRGHILSISMWPGIREICIQMQGHVPRIRTAVTRAGHRDEGPEPPGEGRGQAQASPSSGPSCLVGADGKARPLPRVPGHWGGVDRASHVPLPEGWWRWAPGPATGCIPAGTSVGLVDSQPDVNEEQLGRPCPSSQTNAAAEGTAVAEGAEAWGRGEVGPPP